MFGGLAGVGARGGLAGVSSAGGGSSTIGANSVIDTMLRTAAARSVIGRYAPSDGNVADIVAASDDTFLGRVGGGLAFSAITLAQVTTGAMTLSGSTVDLALSSSGATVTSKVRNTSNTASSAASLLAEVAGTSGGDPSLRLSVAGTTTWDWTCLNAVSDSLDLQADSARVLNISKAGSVGIGTAGGLLGDAIKLHLKGAASACVKVIENVTNTSFAAQYLWSPAGAEFLTYCHGTSAAGTTNGISNAALSAIVTVGPNFLFSLSTACTWSVAFGSGAPKFSMTSTLAMFAAGVNVAIGTADVASTALRVNAAKTIASGAAAVWDGVDVVGSTLTITGSTNIETASGVNLVTLRAPTLSAASALFVTSAATLYIEGAPIAGGAGPADVLGHALRVGSGDTTLGGNLSCQGRFTPGFGGNVNAATSMQMPAFGTWFNVLGSTQIDHIYSSGTFDRGGVLILLFDGTCTATVKHNASGAPGGAGRLILKAAADFTTPAGKNLILLWDGVAGVWREI